MKILGVIGGAGPMATAYFMQQVISMTDAKVDQEHIHILVDNNPCIPDRTKYILDHSAEDPEPVFRNMGQGLIDQGAQVLAIPCITASYFIPNLSESLGVQIVDTIGATIDYLKEASIDCVGLMATDGTIATGLFQSRLEEAGIAVRLPGEKMQQSVMDVVYGKVKAGLPVDPDQCHEIRDELMKAGAQVCILGCTELSVAAMDNMTELGCDKGYLDAMRIMAATSIVACEASLKED